MHYFFKNFPLYSLAKIRQTKYIAMMPKEGSTKIVKFDPRAGVLVLGRGYISHTVKMHYFFKNIFSGARFKQTKHIAMMT